jgi:hypothetical protein
MDNTANSLLNFLLDKSKSIGVKTALTISILGLLLLVDIGLNLSYNLSLNNKISQLERIQNLKQSYQTDSLKLFKILQIENQILNNKHYSDFLRFDFSTSNQISKTKNQNANQTNTATSTPNKSKPIIVSTFWMAVSSNYSLLLIWPILIFLPLFPDQSRQKGFVFGWLALNIIWAGLITLTTVIAFQIPIISDNPNYNYWLNFVIHSSFLILIILVSKNKK